MEELQEIMLPPTNNGFNVDNTDEEPPETEWIKECGLDCCPMVQVQGPQPRIYCGHRDCSFGMPIFCTLLTLFPLGVFLFVVRPRIGNVKILYCGLALIFFTLVMFMWSYMGASCMDPGYLPYNWAKTQKFTYTWKEQLSGLAVREDQLEYAKNHRAPFASFSKSAGRFVIRADHICGWISNWVGKRNHKQFIIMNFWGSMYAISLFIFSFFINSSIMKVGSLNFGLMLGAMGIEIVFAFTLFYVFIFTIKDLLSDITKIQKFKHQKGKKIGKCQAMRQVCGEGNVLCWLIPIPAFGPDMTIDAEDVPEEPNEVE